MYIAKVCRPQYSLHSFPGVSSCPVRRQHYMAIMHFADPCASVSLTHTPPSCVVLLWIRQMCVHAYRSLHKDPETAKKQPMKHPVSLLWFLLCNFENTKHFMHITYLHNCNPQETNHTGVDWKRKAACISRESSTKMACICTAMVSAEGSERRDAGLDANVFV